MKSPHAVAGDYPEFARVAEIMARDNAVFVFGSNRRGAHGGGAAAAAYANYGAKWGQGEGHFGRSYALPTKDTHINTLPIDEVREHIDRFQAYARAHPELVFAVTRIGCGLAGFTDAQIAPLFAGAPANCKLPIGWAELAT